MIRVQSTILWLRVICRVMFVFEQLSANSMLLFDIETLEVTGAFEEEEGVSVDLINIETHQQSNFTLSLENASDAELANYLPIKEGERLKITGYYKDLNRYPFEVIDITRVIKVDNPDKKACELLANKNWRPVGKAQIPTCVTVYNDGGKTCTTSDECEGNCMVQNSLEAAFCESSKDSFGCGAVIEDFKQDGSIICRD